MPTVLLDPQDLPSLAARPLTLHHVPGRSALALLHPSGDRPGLLTRNLWGDWACVTTDVFSGSLAVQPGDDGAAFAAYEVLTLDEVDAPVGEALDVILGVRDLPSAITAIAEQLAPALTAAAGQPVRIQVPDETLGELQIVLDTRHPQPPRPRVRAHAEWI